MHVLLAAGSKAWGRGQRGRPVVCGTHRPVTLQRGDRRPKGDKEENGNYQPSRASCCDKTIHIPSHFTHATDICWTIALIHLGSIKALWVRCTHDSTRYDLRKFGRGRQWEAAVAAGTAGRPLSLAPLEVAP